MIFRAWSGVQLLLDRVANIVEEICQVSLVQLLIIAGQPPVNAGWVMKKMIAGGRFWASRLNGIVYTPIFSQALNLSLSVCATRLL